MKAAHLQSDLEKEARARLETIPLTASEYRRLTKPDTRDPDDHWWWVANESTENVLRYAREKAVKNA